MITSRTTPTLIRTHHTIGRAAEYFDARELEAQTGQRRTMFAAVVLKELVDNALDAAETAGVAPEIGIEIDRRGGDLAIVVCDNGPGLPPAVVAKTLDFDVRTSDKRAYRSPTRGAQGNALKTIIGIPTALGGSAPIVIEACNVRHTIQPRIDTAGNVDPGHTTEAIPPTTGTRIAVTLPAIYQELNAVAWSRAFALANPHATVRITDSDEARNHAYCETFNVSNAPDFYRTWRKWLPTDPTSPHWYDGGAFQALIDAEVASARRGGQESRLVRDFVREFRGLSATTKAKTVCATVPNATRLADLNGAASTLLAAMRAEAKPVKPDALGSVGEDHIRDCFGRWHGIVRNRFWYKRIASTDGAGLPLVIDGFLSNCFVGRSGSTASFVHIVHPALVFLDRGKSMIGPSPALIDAVGQALWHTARTIHADEERRRKDAAAAHRQRQAAEREWARAMPTVSVTDAAFAVMEQAWAQATDNGAWPASARTIFYQLRPLAQQLTDKDITQTVIPAYQREVRTLPGVYYEPRGVLHEPHTGNEVPLGTKEVEGYRLPDWSYDKILFIEKTGLWPVLEQARLAERYDMAIISGSGFATVAARTLLAQAEAGCTIFVVHDADPSGYNISLTLSEETARMPEHRIDVVDIGLTLGEAEVLGLKTEPFSQKKALPERLLPRLGEIERRSWRQGRKGGVSGERVELNAFTTPQLITHIEQALERHGATAKVVPDAATLTAEAEHRIRERVRRRLDELLRDLVDVDTIAMTLGAEIAQEAEPLTPEHIRGRIEPTLPIDWRTAVDHWATATVSPANDIIAAALTDAIREAMAA